MRTFLSLIIGGTGCIAFSACSPDPPETHVYNWKVYKKPGVKYIKRPSTTPRSSYKVGGGGTRHVGGSDTAGGFRAQ